MNRPDEIDTILAGWFAATAPSTVPAEIHPAIIARARSARQHGHWGSVLRETLGRPDARPAIRLASVGVAVVTILVATLAIAGLPAAVPPIGSHAVGTTAAAAATATASVGPQGSPLTSQFEPRFTYIIPDGSGLARIGAMPGAIAWAVGPNRLPTTDAGRDAFGGQRPETGNLHGVVVADVSAAWGHGPDGRVRLRSDPAGFLADMETLLTGMDLEAVTATSLDGRPALTARTVPGAVGDHDLHVDGPMTGLAGPAVVMRGPYRLLVADIDGTTICVEIWARSEEDLAAWLPVAQKFVDSIHFLER